MMTTYQMLFGGLILNVATFLLDQPHIDFHPDHLQEILVLLFLIVMSSIVQFMAWFYVLQNYDPQKASSYLFLVPFFGVISSYFICMMLSNGMSLLGGLLIALGIYLINTTWNPMKTWRRKNRLTE